MKNFFAALFTFTTFAIIFSLITSLEAAPEKNGFNLAGSLIPINKIFGGGPPKDGIPSIDKPKFLKANQARFLKSSDRVIGIEVNGNYRAYPIKILNWHEIVNDRVGNHPIVVTYCPLCGTGMVYDAKIGGHALQFGVSGLLYNSDVLLYDRQTQSLWSQILSKAISGKQKGTKLKIIHSSHTSWIQWKKRHPNTLVLSTDTGYQRNYDRSPYGDYDNNQAIYFPLAAKSKRYHPKERVIGITINGNHKAYPFAELSRSRSNTLSDTFTGRTLRIDFDSDNRDGHITDQHGNLIPSVNSFWFAWYAFHPDTKVYKYRK
ncbi:MAG TPA: DUF3179 domain-containing protein [Leucothrix mucor]|nr:DUF3179 domain-containing protein [Leucothrix mucor]